MEKQEKTGNSVYWREKVAAFFEVKLACNGDFFPLFVVVIIAYDTQGKFHLELFLTGFLVWLLVMGQAKRLPREIRPYFSYGFGLLAGLAVSCLTQNPQIAWTLGGLLIVFLCVELWGRSRWRREVMLKIQGKEKDL